MFGSGVTVFFRIFNLVSFGGIAFYFFYKKTVPTLRQKIAEKKSLEQGLQSDYKDLVKHKELLLQKMADQKILYDELEIKAQKWQASVREKQRQIEQEQELVEQRIKDKVAQQEKIQAQKRLQMNVIPVAVADARQQLRAAFSSVPSGKEYIHVILNQLGQKV